MIFNRELPLATERAWVSYWVLLGALLLTGIATYSAARVFQTRDRLQFANGMQQTKEAIERRLEIYTEMLVLGSALYSANREVSQQEFRDYVRALRVHERYPGIQGIGFTLRVASDQKEGLIRRMRQEGFPEFRIWPESKGEECHTIVYLEPLDRRNQRAIGYDMSAESVRQAAMFRARDSGQPAASGKVTLVQEMDEQVQPGFLIYVPVYRGGKPPSTVEQRRNSLLGFVYSPFRAGDLLRGIFGDGRQLPVDFRVFDGPEPKPANLLYRSSDRTRWHPRLHQFLTINIAGRQWTLEFASGANIESTSGVVVVPFLAFGGLVVSLVLFRLTSNQAKAYSAVEQTAARLRDSQAKLAASEELHRLVAEAAADSIITIDEHGAIRSVNRATEEIFGYDAPSLIGKPFAMLLPDRVLDPHGAFAALVESSQKARGGQTMELWARHRSGQEMPVEISLSGYVREGQQYFTGIIRDITRRKEAEAEIQRLNQELEQRVRHRTAALQETNDQLEAFTYTVAHDLRAPLRAMQGFSQALVEDYGPRLEEQGQDYARRIVAASERMDSLIQDLLAYSRLSRARFMTVPLELGPILDRLLLDFAAEIKARQAVVTVERPLPKVRAHASTLEHILSHLVANALKFVGPNTPPQIRIWAKQRNPSVRIYVGDNGIGIPAEHHGRIFRVFERLHGSESFPGTGIGLAIVKKGVEQMGGSVGLESEPEQGSLFWIELPGADESDGGAGQAS